MNTMKKFFLIWLIFLLFISGGLVTQLCAQTKKIDSLKSILSGTADEKKKIETLLALCGERYSLDNNTLLSLCSEGKQLLVRNPDKISEGYFDFYKALAFSRSGKVDSALVITDKLLSQIQYEGPERELYARFNNLKGIILFRQNRQKESLDYLLGFLGQSEKSKDTLAQLSVYNTISSIYASLSQYTESVARLQKGMTLLHDPLPEKYLETVFMMQGNMGVCYLHMYQAKPNPAWADSCIYFSDLSIDGGARIQNLYLQSHSLGVKGLMLSYLKKPVEAEVYLKKGLEIRKQLGDPLYILSDMSVLSSFYANTGQTEKGIALSLEGIQLSEKTKNSTILHFLYSSLAENYKAAGNLNMYGETLKKLIGVKDSVYKINSAEALSEIQTKYEVQKKESTITRQKYDLARKNYYMIGVVFLFIATLLAGLLFINNRRKNQRLRLQQVMMEEKQKTVHAVLEAEEEERKRIAADLHDSVAQKLVVAKMNLESFQSGFKTGNEQQQKTLQHIETLLSESATEVRQLSHSMMPQAFSQSGLTDAVKDFLDKIESAGLKTNFIAEGDFTKLAGNKALMIYRIIQESVQNVLKHAHATQLNISIYAENSEIDITIEDNGVGFESQNPALSESQGLKNIRSRIEYLNGKAEINSQPGKGTVLAFFIPFEN